MHLTLPAVAAFAGMALAAPQAIRQLNRQAMIQNQNLPPMARNPNLGVVPPTGLGDGVQDADLALNPVDDRSQQQSTQGRYFRDGKPVSLLASEARNPANPATKNQIDPSQAWAGPFPDSEGEAAGAFSPQPDYSFQLAQGQTMPQELEFEQQPSGEQLPGGRTQPNSLPNPSRLQPGQLQPGQLGAPSAPLRPGQLQNGNAPFQPGQVQNGNRNAPLGQNGNTPYQPGQMQNGNGNGNAPLGQNGNRNAPLGQTGNGAWRDEYRNVALPPGATMMQLPDSSEYVPTIAYDKNCQRCKDLETKVYNSCFKAIPLDGSSATRTVKNCHIQRVNALAGCDRMCVANKKDKTVAA